MLDLPPHHNRICDRSQSHASHLVYRTPRCRSAGTATAGVWGICGPSWALGAFPGARDGQSCSVFRSLASAARNGQRASRTSIRHIGVPRCGTPYQAHCGRVSKCLRGIASNVGSLCQVTDAVIVDSLSRASAAVGDLIEKIDGDQWTAPTPCTEWNVRDVVAHLHGMNLVFIAVLEAGPMPERGLDRLGTEPAAAFRRSAAALQTAAARPGTLDWIRASAVGDASGVERMRWRIADLLTHAWDLMEATGIQAEMPDDLVEQSFEFARIQLPNQSRVGRFADPQPIPDEATLIDRLAALTGRPVPWPKPISTHTT